MFDINLIKNRIEYLSDKVIFLKKAFNFNLKKDRLEKINFELEQVAIWEKPEIIRSLGKERSCLEEMINTINNINQCLDNAKILLELVIEEQDKEILLEIKKELNNLEKKLDKLELRSMFSGINDHLDCYIDIQAGSGGTEAQDWANILLRMYLKWLEAHNFNVKIIEESEGEIIGIKSITIKVKGNYAYGWLRTETGIHRLVRKSPFDSGRRHTSFSSVFVYPEINDKMDIKINQTDLRIDFYRASGAGGQHINRTESAVRIIHLPTNTIVQCQNERSQHQNKEQAIKQLKAKLYELQLQTKKKEKKMLEDSKPNIGWSHQIRSYILDNSLIKDLRTGLETHNIQSVLNGNLDKFIEASLRAGL